MPVTQLLSFVSTPAFRDDRALLTPLAAKLKTQAGFVSTHFGIQVEDPTVGYVVNIWESNEHHEATLSGAEHAPVAALLAPAISDRATLKSIKIGPPPADWAHANQAPYDALSAPVVELAQIRVKGGKKELDEVWQLLKQAVELSPGKDEFWGQVVGKEQEAVAFVAWDKVEDHIASWSIPELAAVTGKVRELVEPSLVHVKFWKTD